MPKVKPRKKIGGVPVWCSFDKVIQVKALKPNPDNPNTHPEEQIDLLVGLIKAHGWRGPITVSNRSGMIVRGHGRYLAAIQGGFKSVPVDFQDYESDEAEVLDLIADNKIAELSIVDDDLADSLIEALDLNDFDPGMIGVMVPGLDEVTGGPDSGPAEKEPPLPEVSKRAKTKPGDIYALGDHRILCGDATKVGNLKKLLQGAMANMCFTDPPYLMAYTGAPSTKGRLSKTSKAHRPIANDNIDNAEAGVFLSKIALIIKRFVSGSYYLCFYRLGLEKIINALLLNGLNYKSVIIWHKNHHNLSGSDYQSIYEPIVYGWNEEHNFYGSRSNFDFLVSKKERDGTPAITTQGKAVYLKVGDSFYIFERMGWKPNNYIDVVENEPVVFNLFGGENDVWEINKTKKNDLHPTMKPVEVCKKAILNSSVEGDVVLDLFLGSGSTLIACEESGRKCYGLELDPLYCDVIVKRWEDFTGKKAKLL